MTKFFTGVTTNLTPSIFCISISVSLGIESAFSDIADQISFPTRTCPIPSGRVISAITTPFFPIKRYALVGTVFFPSNIF